MTARGSAAEARFGLPDLVEAHLSARRYAEAHPDLREHYAARASAVGAALRIDLSAPPADADDLVRLLAETLCSIERLRSPFDGYLEASAPVVAMHGRHAAGIAASRARLHAELVELAVSIVASAWNKPRDVSVTVDELVAHGFDPRGSSPDPSDYW